MKLRLLTMVISLTIASCAPSQPYRSRPGSYSGDTGRGTDAGSSSGSIGGQTKPANTYSQDAVECERKAALSQVGGRGEAFAACMRARGYSAGR